MEYALYVSSVESLSKYGDKPLPAGGLPQPFDRLYFGQEFCERLIPSFDDLKEAFEFAKKRKMNFTLVTPFVTESGLLQWGNLLKKYNEINQGGEVVINDLGLSDFIDDNFPGLIKILGRLLTKQKRGPQILRLSGKVPDEMLAHFSCFNADVPDLTKFYKEIGFSRYEIDNTLQEIRRNGEMQASLYFPYIYVTTTRMCLTNNSDNRKESMRAIFPCKKECRNIRFKISHHEIPVPVIIAGNTQFIHNENLPPNPDKLKINRLVYQPEIPIS